MVLSESSMYAMALQAAVWFCTEWLRAIRAAAAVRVAATVSRFYLPYCL